MAVHFALNDPTKAAFMRDPEYVRLCPSHTPRSGMAWLSGETHTGTNLTLVDISKRCSAAISMSSELAAARTRTFCISCTSLSGRSVRVTDSPICPADLLSCPATTLNGKLYGKNLVWVHLCTFRSCSSRACKRSCPSYLHRPSARPPLPPAQAATAPIVQPRPAHTDLQAQRPRKSPSHPSSANRPIRRTSLRLLLIRETTSTRSRRRSWSNVWRRRRKPVGLCLWTLDRPLLHYPLVSHDSPPRLD